MKDDNEMKLTIASLNLNSCNSVYDRKVSNNKGDTKYTRIKNAIKKYKTIDLWALQEISVKNESIDKKEIPDFFDSEIYYLLRRTIRRKQYKTSPRIVNKIYDYKLDIDTNSLNTVETEFGTSENQKEVPETDYNDTVEFRNINKNAIMTGFLCKKELIGKDKPIINWNNNADVPRKLIEICEKELKNHLDFYDEKKKFPTSYISAVNYKFQEAEIKIINIHIPADRKNRYIIFNTLYRYLDENKEQNIVLIGDFNLYKKNDKCNDCTNIMSDSTTACTALLEKLEGLEFKEIRNINESKFGHYTYVYSNKNGSKYLKKLDHIYVSKLFSDNFQCSVNYVDDVNFDREDIRNAIDTFNKEWSIDAFTDHSLIIAEISIK